ncbi:hypothetical protein [Cellulomonas xiejunii]|uniref:hypothetical protein n=1 Tax=Cellulomonas xiejunii TaxID=2968083 RepID=UPI001D0DE19F|nr:hypothetical protein [Cellulomonas xiejunii]MCC2315283.1 hypothetical protein [Cellulomonas xiejunii]
MNPDERRLGFVMVEDSDDARLFIELSSYAVDLVEARDALALALQSTAPADSPLQNAERSLIANAAMAYCRTFFPSKVRRPITTFVQIPARVCATHDLVAKFRNRMIAHSQSDLSVTYAVGVLDADTHQVLDVSAPNISSTIPPEQVRNFIELVAAVTAELDDVIAPVRTRLMAKLAAADRATLLEAGLSPTPRMLPATEFGSPRSRPPYPTTHPIYLGDGNPPVSHGS